MLSKKLLQRRWIHSHEEDTDTDAVYRPADFDFPASRGRRALEFKAGGAYSETNPGPVDRPVASHGTWKLAKDDVLTVARAADATSRELKVKSLSNDRLVIAKT
jgi:hypothetical protein